MRGTSFDDAQKYVRIGGFRLPRFMIYRVAEAPVCGLLFANADREFKGFRD
jgi:hypothetical protein